MRALITFQIDTDPAVEELSIVADEAENLEGIISRVPCFDGARLVRVERVPERDRHG